MVVKGVQHVSIGIEAGREQEGRWFYGEALGLPEKPRPMALKHMALIWFDAGASEIHLICNDPDRFEPIRAGDHFCLQVDDLGAYRRRLTELNVAIREATPIGNRPRFFVEDPFRNLVEIIEVQGPFQPVEA